MAGASVPQAILTPLAMAFADRLLGSGKDIGGLGLQFGRSMRQVHPVSQVRGGYEEAASVHHEVDGLVAHERAVLDAVDSRFDGGPDPVVTVGVGGHAEPRSVRLVDHGTQLLVRVLLCSRRAGVRHHAARGAHLDQLGPVLDLVAHGLADLGHSVGDALFDREGQHMGCEGLEHGGIEMAAGGADGVPGRHNPWSVDIAAVDGLLERHVEEQAARLHEEAEVAYRGEAGPQRTAGVDHGAQSAESRVVLHGVEGAAMVGSSEEQVHLHVHEAGQEGEVSELDGDSPIRHARGHELGDVVADDQDVTGFPDLSRHDVEHAGASETDRFGSPGRAHDVLLVEGVQHGRGVTTEWG